MDVTILFADLRGFTHLSAIHPGEMVIDILNRCLIALSAVVVRHGGTVNKFIGDSMMVLFGAPDAQPDQVVRALACAVEMQETMEEVNRRHGAAGLPELFLGIGLNTGTVMAGVLGSESYSEYTVIGDAVNLAARVEAFSLRGQILATERVVARAGNFVATGEPMNVRVKGKQNPVKLFEVLSIPTLGKTVARRDGRRSPRVEAKIPFTFEMVENDIVMPGTSRGMIVDIAYHGVGVELGQALAPHAEIKLALNLPLVEHGASAEAYGRIVGVRRARGAYKHGIEFTSISAQTKENVRFLVQLLLQGSTSK